VELRLRSDPIYRDSLDQAARAVLSPACHGVIIVGRDFISCHVTRNPVYELGASQAFTIQPNFEQITLICFLPDRRFELTDKPDGVLSRCGLASKGGDRDEKCAIYLRGSSKKSSFLAPQEHAMCSDSRILATTATRIAN
jgi:hypothetical protein